MSQLSNSSNRAAVLVIACGSLIVLLSFGIRSAFGLFLAPVSEELGWGREIFALSIALQNLLWGFTQPFAGAIADRYGYARVIFTGACLYLAGLLIMAGTSTPGEMYIGNGVLIGMGLSGTAFGVMLPAIANAVDESKRSLALGIGTAAGSIGQLVMAPIGNAFLEAYGWSTAVLLLAICGVAMLPLARAMRGRSENAGPAQSLGEALSEASRHRGYGLLVLGFFVCGFHVAFITAHMPAYITDAGLPRNVGAWAIALIGGFNIIGSFSAGYLGGGMSKKKLLSLIYLGRSFVILVFVISPLTTSTVYFFSAAMGLLWLSTVPLTSGLVGQIFGPRYMGTLFGIVFLSHQLGSFLGVWLGGRLYDQTGNYDVIWGFSILLGVLSAAVHWPIDERPVERSTVAVG